MSAYADTSFLVSIYTPDANSVLAVARMKRVRLPVLLTLLGELELVNALQLRLFRKELTRSQITTTYSMFSEDTQKGIFQMKPLTLAMYERAKAIVLKQTPRLGSRTLDILHVASALVLQADTFYTFDRIQAKLARAEKLIVA